MPTWTGNILQTYKVYREERVQIGNSEIDCRMRMYDNLQYQSIVRLEFELIVSGRFSPLTAPLTLTRHPSPAPLPFRRIFSSPAPAPLPLIRFPGPLRSIFRSRSSHMLCVMNHNANLLLHQMSIHRHHIPSWSLPLANRHQSPLSMSNQT